MNSDPEALGCRPAARGFPYCSASIIHPARGYAAALGWVQLVRSTDGSTGGESFEMDPLEPLGRVDHPFAFFGLLPTLFDAPSRDPIRDMDWTAHSFLCHLEEERGRTRSSASRGASSSATEPSLRGGQIRSLEDWDAHRPVLVREHPRWSFASAPGQDS